MKTEGLVFNGTSDEFYAKLEEFAAYLRTQGHELYARWAIKPERGNRALFCLDTSNGGILFIVAIEYIARENIVDYSLDDKDLDTYGSEIFTLLSDYMQSVETKQANKAGRKTYACNVWLDHMINIKGWAIGSDSEDNKLFQMWKKLYLFETNKDPDNPDDVADPWRSYTAAAGKK